MTVRELCEKYLTATEKGLILGEANRPKKPSTLYTDRGRIERHVIPLLGSKLVIDLTTPTSIEVAPRSGTVFGGG